MDSRAREVIKIGNACFNKKQEIDSLWQEIALIFYPERADFTTTRDWGEEFADHLSSSWTILARREMGNMMSAALRPRSSKWMSVHVENEGKDKQHRAFLEWITDIQWRVMYDRQAMFVRATKETDHDFVAFGNGVIKVCPNQLLNGLYYRNFHLRDCAWLENAWGKVDCIFIRWEPTARQLHQQFPETSSKETKEAYKKTPEKPVKCMIACMPQRLYEYKGRNSRMEFPFASLIVELETETTLEEEGLHVFPYVVPRWATLGNFPYGHSMATSVMLPDGRTTQVVIQTLREAGEKYVNPPLLAQGDVVRGDVSLYAGGITQIDKDYDEKLGAALRPITQDRGGMPIGFEIAEALKQDLQHGFFLDKIQMPPPADGDMTAYEVRRRFEEHLRAQSPIYEPIEHDYNEPLCRTTFEWMMHMDIGDQVRDVMPQDLTGEDVHWSFRSPLKDMADAQDVEIYKEGMATIWMPLAEIKPAEMANVNHRAAARDASKALGWKEEWLNPPEVVDEEEQRLAQQQEQQAQLAQIEDAGAAATAAGEGMKAITDQRG